MPATAISAIAALYLSVGLLALAPRKPGYSHFRHSISELGETGTPDQRLVAFGLFLPVGLAVFPCEPGSPMSGAWRQGLHNLAGGVEYIGGDFALMAISESLGQPFKLAGFIVLGAAIAISVVPSNPVRGLVQRIAETCLLGGLASAAWQAA